MARSPARLGSRLRQNAPRLGIVAALLAIAASIVLLTSFDRQNLSNTSESYDNFWVSHQLLIEYQQLVTDLVRAEHGDPASSAETVRLRLDILVSRERMMIEGRLAEAFGNDPTYKLVVDALDQAIADTDRELAGLASSTLPETARRIRVAIEGIEEPIRDLRLAVRSYYAELNDAVRRRQDLYLTLIVVLFSSGGLGAVAFGVAYARQQGRLRRSEETFRTTFDRAGVGIAHLARDGRFLQVNATICALLGRDDEALRNRDIHLILPEVTDFEAFIEPITSGRAPVINLEHGYRGTDQTQRLAALTFSLVRRPSDEIDYVIAIMEDVTERRSIEAQLQQAQKMEAVGQLTGGVAHDFNNLLGVIIGNLDMLDAMLERNTEPHRLLERALAAAERGASMTKRLLAFSRRQSLLPQPTDVNRLVGDIGVLLRPTLGDKIQVKTNLAPGLDHALVDPGQLEAALVNLAINSRDAMEAEGVLTIATAVFDPDATTRWELTAQRYVVVSVSDNGAGMSPDVLDRVFEPFFTTKGVGKGSGLGLSMVYGFVKQSGGHVQIESKLGQGTTVRLYLPAAVALQAEVA